jgi:hypothetical protein
VDLVVRKFVYDDGDLRYGLSKRKLLRGRIGFAHAQKKNSEAQTSLFTPMVYCLKLIYRVKAFFANKLTLVLFYIINAGTEDARWAVFAEDDVGTLHVDFEGITLLDIKFPAKLCRKNNSSEVVDLPDNAN